MNHSMYAALLFAMLSGMQPERPPLPDTQADPRTSQTAAQQEPPPPEQTKKLPTQS